MKQQVDRSEPDEHFAVFAQRRERRIDANVKARRIDELLGEQDRLPSTVMLLVDG